MLTIFSIAYNNTLLIDLPIPNLFVKVLIVIHLSVSKN